MYLSTQQHGLHDMATIDTLFSSFLAALDCNSTMLLTGDYDPSFTTVRCALMNAIGACAHEHRVAMAITLANGHGVPQVIEVAGKTELDVF
jgi:hypothetical protein